MDLRNYGVIDFAEHVVLPTGDADDLDELTLLGKNYNPLTRGAKQTIIDDLKQTNKELTIEMTAVRAENKRYLAQHHDDQIEMHKFRVENEQLQLLQDARKEKSKVIVDLENEIKQFKDNNELLQDTVFERNTTIYDLRNEIKSLKKVVSNLRINQKNEEQMMIQKAQELREKTTILTRIKRIRSDTEWLLEEVKFQGRIKQAVYQEAVGIYFKSMQKIDQQLEVEKRDPPPTPAAWDKKAPFTARAKTGIKHSHRTHDKRI